VNPKKTSIYFLPAVLALMVLLNSCLPERKVATTFIQTPHMINLLVNPPEMVYKYNHKGEEIEGFDSLAPAKQDSALWENSKYIRFVEDSLLLENYMNNFIGELRLLGFNVYLNATIDSFSSAKPQSYVLDIPQMQLDEYLYPLEDEDAFLDTVYYKTFLLNAVDFSCWFELGKAFTANSRKTLLYATNTAYDTFDGRFFNDPFTGTIRYKYNIDELHSEDVYNMATYLGKMHAGFLYEFFLKQYIAKHLPEGLEMMDYYHYSRTRKNISPAGEERFEILGTK
jgi:hypothetical protein